MDSMSSTSNSHSGSSGERPNGIYISVDQIYMLLQETNTRLGEIRGDIRALADKAETTLVTISDHETRLRSLERWKYGIPLTVVASMCSVVATVILSLVI